MKVLKNFMHLILSFINLLLIIMIVINILNLISTKILKESYPKFLDYTYFTALTNNNDIKKGDFLLLDLSEVINEDDYIVYYQNDTYYTGKIISKKDGKIIIQNDTLTYNIEQEQVVGKITYTISKLGNMIELFKKTITLIIAIILLIIFTILTQFLNKNIHKDSSKPNFKQTW